MVDCDVCGGEGFCNRCGGSGSMFVRDMTDDLPFGDLERVTCDDCGGSGNCPRCDGFGKVERVRADIAGGDDAAA